MWGRSRLGLGNEHTTQALRLAPTQADSSESGAAAASTACSAPPPPPPLGAQQQEVQLQAAAQLSFAASAQEAAAALAACTQQLAGAGTNDALKSLIDSMARCMAVAAAMMAGAAVHTRLVPPAGSLGAATEGVLAPMGSGEGGGVGGSSSGGGDGGSGYGGSGNGTSSAATQAVPCNLPMQLGKVSSVVKVRVWWDRVLVRVTMGSAGRAWCVQAGLATHHVMRQIFATLLTCTAAHGAVLQGRRRLPRVAAARGRVCRARWPHVAVGRAQQENVEQREERRRPGDRDGSGRCRRQVCVRGREGGQRAWIAM